MSFLTKPIWIFFAVTIPQVILILLYISSYKVIGSLLSVETFVYWKHYGITLVAALLLFTVYAVYAMLQKKEVHVIVIGLMLLFYIAFLYLYSMDMDKIVPWNIPRWMLFSGDLQIYVYTFIMPALLYSLHALVVKATPSEKRHRAWVSFIPTAVIPLTWYLLFNVFSAFRSNSGNPSEVYVHLCIMAFISSTVLFLFFLIRWIYVILINSGEKFRRFEWLWKIPFAIIFPLLGLAVSNGDMLSNNMHEFKNVFGNFSSAWFFNLAIVNGICVCLPTFSNKILRFISFIFRCLMFPYTFYFFIVFLPWFPLSILAIIAFGLGFLMLAPLTLMAIHTQTIIKDYQTLKQFYTGKKLKLLMVSAFLFIPLIIILTDFSDRKNLHKALDYVYAPDLSKPSEKIDTKAIMRTLEFVQQNKTNNGNGLIMFEDNNNVPFISTFYRWLVLDNLTITNKKAGLLEKIFTGTENIQDQTSRWRRLPGYEPNVKIDSVNTSTQYYEKEKFWKTQVKLVITNHTEREQQFSTQFYLPDGCMIDDYHLLVNGINKKGILAEKHAAMWVYQEIVSTNRDPGILYYQAGNHVTFNVFPLIGNQTRYTEIEFIHKDPLILKMDSVKIQLGDTTKSVQNEIAYFPEIGAVFLPNKIKENLPKVIRKPFYHFIVDASNDTEQKREEKIKRVEKLLSKKFIDNTEGKISLVNYREETMSLNENWKEKLISFPAEGGFFAELAMQKSLAENYKKQEDIYPVFIVVSDNPEKAIFTGALEDFRFTFPESDNFYILNPDGKLFMCSIANDTINYNQPINQLPKYQVIEYKSNNIKAYLPIDGNGSFVLSNSDKMQAPKQTGNQWDDAMYLQALTKHCALHPEQAEDKWLDIVKGSFKTRVMLPSTSYIVVEDEAQEQALLEKQKQILSSKKTLDTSEDIHVMSEPPIWMILLIVSIVILLKRRKRILGLKN